MRQLLFHPFYLLALGAIFCGAGTEIVLNQWSSTFMEKALELPKVAGDLLGMCGFAAMLGLARLLYGLYGSKIDISRVLTLGAAVSVVCYLTVALSPFDALNVAAARYAASRRGCFGRGRWCWRRSGSPWRGRGCSRCWGRRETSGLPFPPG